MVALFGVLATIMVTGHSSIDSRFDGIENDLREIRTQLNSVDRRLSRVEGHLFGIEVQDEPEAKEE